MLDRKQLELESLLEVTQAINANMPEESLYKIFYFTCKSNLRVGKFALFVNEEEQLAEKICYGVTDNYNKEQVKIILENIDAVCILKEHPMVTGLTDFDVIVPVFHKSKLLAYILVGGVEIEEGERSSAITFIQTFGNIVMVAIENKRFSRQQLAQEAYKKEMEIASQVQSLLFPSELPSNEHMQIFATYLPHRSVGGDYYDYFDLNEDQFFICIADVSGKGVPAALIMSNFQACLRTLIRKTHDLEEIVREINSLISNTSKGEKFITFFGAIVDKEKKTMTYVNSGHNPAYYFDYKTDKLTMLEEGSTILGILPELPFINVSTVDYSQDSLLFMYTDGLTETMNPQGEEYGEDRLESFLCSWNLNRKDMHQDIIEKINLFRQGRELRDDITMLSCFFL